MEARTAVTRHRWVVLFAVFPMIVSNEIMWLSIAPVSSQAQQYYGVGATAIDLLSISYMIMFILFSIPASWAIDRFGFRTSLIVGALLTAVFSVVRAAFADDFMIVLVAQFLIALGQPFLLNISTKVPANWFPIQERSTAAGILTMAQYVGFAVPMLLSPMLAGAHEAAGAGIPRMMWVYAAVACASAVIAIGLTRERPEVPPPGPAGEAQQFSTDTFARLFRNGAYVRVLVVCFLSMGIFNTILTVLESILLPGGLSSAQAGVIGAVFVLAGVVGAVVLPIASDARHVRIPFLVAAVSLLTAAYLGFAFLHSFPVLVAVGALAGFSIMGVAPILFQHGTEVAYPVQEGTSLGLVLLMGQISGVLFVLVFEAATSATGGPTAAMLGVVALTALQVPIVWSMRESGLDTQGAPGRGDRVEEAGTDA